MSPDATPAAKFDPKKELDSYRAKAGEFRILDVPPRAYLMVDGEGDPNTSASYREAVESLYPVAYALKFRSKKELARDYVVPPLEALWWADDWSAFTRGDRGEWRWTAMIYVPDWLTQDDVEAALAASESKAPAIERVRFETLDEGLSVQTLHVGAYSEEGPTLARMHDEFVPAEGLRMRGQHHEIYLGDPRKTAPEKLRTILRQPVERA